MTPIKLDVLDFINTLSDEQKAHVWHELNWAMWPTCIPIEMQPSWWNLKEVQMVKIEYAGRRFAYSVLFMQAITDALGMEFIKANNPKNL